MNPVGYHAWSSEGGLLLFVLGEPHTLQWWTPGNDPVVVASDIGRSLLPIPGTNLLSFVHKDGKEEWWLKSFDPESGQIAEMIATLEGREDLAWDPTGKAWMADGGRLYRYCPNCGGGWRRIVDFGRSGIQGSPGSPSLRTARHWHLSPTGLRLHQMANSPQAASESTR